MPNAGHTYIDSKGQTMVHKVLPNGIVSPNLRVVMIGPGSVFDIDRLDDEIAHAKSLGYLPFGVQLFIHPQAMVLRASHKAAERATLSSISSTMQGSAAAAIEKMMRSKEANTAANVVAGGVDDGGYPLSYNYPWFESSVVTQEEWRDALESAESILAEGSQGYSLGINTAFYPFTTSRDCTPARFLSDMGVPHSMLRKVIGTARTFPIRVGNTADGHSGACYPDQKETSWEELGQIAERTTVTQRIRRVFTFSMEQVEEACFYCAPDEIFLNFCNYMPDEVPALASKIGLVTGVPVGFFGFGPSFHDVLPAQVK
jgi:adenylosuccinate synthase